MQGATEFSFEELRAIKIRKRVEEERLRAEKEELARIASECAEKQSEMRRQQEAFREEQGRIEKSNLYLKIATFLNIPYCVHCVMEVFYAQILYNEKKVVKRQKRTY